MTRIDKFGPLVAMVIASASAVSIARAQQSIQKAHTDIGAGVEKILPGGFKMESRPIEFSQERIDLTLAYRRIHQDPHAKDILIRPKMIILHWTGINSLDSTWNYFNRTRTEAARSQLAAAGEVNVSAHFLVDRDGTVFRLMPETWMARHCIGLNQVAIGIENIGDGEKFPLTDAQAKANAAL
ncbi:MAG TPA: peptidoglycan recognition family protein, partial [Candidatus Angelobacter sp.]|nr:peptidoglycan recognition family protein [Candidatus Angelobacter sp.]